tara:strand:- start:1211 stop:1906 length:696 start_codon:yes stop_codon:yes gene_type:complete
MAVLGNKKTFNKDPLMMPRVMIHNSYHYRLVPSTTYNSSDNARNRGLTSFFYNDNNRGSPYSFITSASVANTYRTIVNLSGFGGFLTYCMGPYAGGGSTTWKITVDGVETEILCSTDGTNQATGDLSSALGPKIRSIPNSAAIYGSAAGGAGYTTGQVWNYTTFNSDRTTYNLGHIQTSYFGFDPHPLDALESKDEIVRFDVSLKVEVKCANAQAVNSSRSYAGVIYFRDQ